MLPNPRQYKNTLFEPHPNTATRYIPPLNLVVCWSFSESNFGGPVTKCSANKAKMGPDLIHNFGPVALTITRDGVLSPACCLLPRDTWHEAGKGPPASGPPEEQTYSWSCFDIFAGFVRLNVWYGDTCRLEAGAFLCWRRARGRSNSCRSANPTGQSPRGSLPDQSLSCSCGNTEA